MIEFFNLMKKRPVKMLLDSSAIGSFVLDAMAIALKYKSKEMETFLSLC